MEKTIRLDDIIIRTEMKPGDLGYLIYRHAKVYSKEYDYGQQFEAYIVAGLYEFYKNYNPELDRIWLAEHDENTIGFLLLMHRENNSAQLRYFLIEPEYRGIGLGKKLMALYMNFLKQCGYKSSYLWTTHELTTAASLYTCHGFRLTQRVSSRSFGKDLIECRYDLNLVE